uniref:Y-family DNA polymerase n=1 Tax=Paracoccus jeotgali TaxID=2065379 RepID=UPI0028AF8835|nr:DNA polymerase Y family protein [Paracoccus jeotgali]
MWFPRLASDRVLRACPTDRPFALFLRQHNSDVIHCLNHAAEAADLSRGMRMTDARSFCPELISQPTDPAQDTRFLHLLRRWAGRYCPWVGIEPPDGLVLDITGSAHLWGDEAGMLDDMRDAAARAGMTLHLGLGDTRGAAWALAHYGQGVAAPGDPAPVLALPVAALRIPAEMATGLQRLGLRRVGELDAAARAPLARRFGPHLMLRLDQALGRAPESITPAAEPVHYATRLTLPEPIGLESDLMAATERLLDGLCAKLATQQVGARTLRLELRRVDSASQHITLRLAAAMREPARILPLFGRSLGKVDAGFGIDQIRLEAVLVEPLPETQTGIAETRTPDRLADLMTRIGTRIGLDNLHRFQPADSHIPERAFTLTPATLPPTRQAAPARQTASARQFSSARLGATPDSSDGQDAAALQGAAAPPCGWSSPRPRPLRLFDPEPIIGRGASPPRRFRWRRMVLNTARATGPERIAPEWWQEDSGWRGGLRDYWMVETRQGRRLWMFHTPQAPGWFVQGEFA